MCWGLAIFVVQGGSLPQQAEETSLTPAGTICPSVGWLLGRRRVPTAPLFYPPFEFAPFLEPYQDRGCRDLGSLCFSQSMINLLDAGQPWPAWLL